MADLKTTYLGIEIKNPLIIGASNLVTDVDALRQIEDAGAAAIVYKSLFEEQIQLERMQHDDGLEEYNERHAEMVSLFPRIQHAGPEAHLLHLRNAIEKVNIPVIASLNCVYDVSWADYAKNLEEAGAAALELNFYANPLDSVKSGMDIVDQQIAVLKKVRQTVKIPISVKLSPFYTNLLGVVSQMDTTGVNGFVLFNRIFQPDINIETEEFVFPWFLSNSGDYRLSLRYAGLLHGKIKADICGNTGILTGDDMIQMLLAGADAVQVVTTLYKNGFGNIKVMLAALEKWMDAKNYHKIDDFKGKLAKEHTNDPFAYKRSQYVDILMHSNDLFRKYPMR